MEGEGGQLPPEVTQSKKEKFVNFTKKVGHNFKELGRGFLAAIVDSRLQPGYNLPLTKEGKSVKDYGLEGLGFKKDENGNLIDTNTIEKTSQKD